MAVRRLLVSISVRLKERAAEKKRLEEEMEMWKVIGPKIVKMYETLDRLEERMNAPKSEETRVNNRAVQP